MNIVIWISWVILLLVACSSIEFEKRKCIDGVVYSKHINDDYWIETNEKCKVDVDTDKLLN